MELDLFSLDHEHLYQSSMTAEVNDSWRHLPRIQKCQPHLDTEGKRDHLNC